MVDFPGEDESAFGRTLGLVRECGVEGVRAAIYSPRPGTAALRLGALVPAPVAIERLARVNVVAAELALTAARRFIGRTVTVLIEDNHRGRTECTREVRADFAHVEPGSLRDVTITSARPWELDGCMPTT